MQRPVSDVSIWTGTIGFIAFCGIILLILALKPNENISLLLLLCGVAFPMVLWDVLVEKVHLRKSAGFDYQHPRLWQDVRPIATVKLVGLYATFALVGLCYFTLKTFSGNQFTRYFQWLSWAVPVLICLAPPYVFLTARYQRNYQDDLWHFGKLALCQFSQVDRARIYNHLLAWAIKGFFLSFMFSIIQSSFWSVVKFDLSNFWVDPRVFAWYLITISFLVDICFGTIGYIVSLKVLDSHIRSANPLLSGWVAAMLCYPPIIIMGGGGPLDYRTGTDEWWFWLDGYDIATFAWGVLLVLATMLYASATVIFGFRFSNLTNRGIITAGPFRYFKHPAYLAKNVFWWLAHVPFLAWDGADVALRNSLLLLCVNGIYYWRAKTEEKHLMEEPKYRAYSEWIAEHGVIPRCTRGIRRRLVRIGLG